MSIKQKTNQTSQSDGSEDAVNTPSDRNQTALNPVNLSISSSESQKSVSMPVIGQPSRSYGMQDSNAALPSQQTIVKTHPSYHDTGSAGYHRTTSIHTTITSHGASASGLSQTMPTGTAQIVSNLQTSKVTDSSRNTGFQPQFVAKLSNKTEDDIYPADATLPRTAILRLVRKAANYSTIRKAHNLTAYNHTSATIGAVSAIRSVSQNSSVSAFSATRTITSSPSILVDYQGISVTEDALNDIQKHAQDFISFITNEANERCSQDKRKTITGDDIIEAFSFLGFDEYASVLRIYFEKFKQFRTLKGPSGSSNQEYSMDHEDS